MRFNILMYTALVVFIVSNTACMNKATPNRPHELQLEQKTTDAASTSNNLGTCDMLKLQMKNKEVDVCGMEQTTQREDTFNQLYNIIFESDFLNDPNIYGRAQASRLILLLNTSLLAQSDKRLSKAQDVYIKTLLQDCDTHCKFVHLFAQSSNTFNVLRAILSQPGFSHPQIQQLYTIALSLKNGTDDPKIVRMMLAQLNNFKKTQELKDLLQTRILFLPYLTDAERENLNKYLQIKDSEKIFAGLSPQETILQIQKWQQGPETNQQQTIANRANQILKQRPQIIQKWNLDASQTKEDSFKLLDLVLQKQISLPALKIIIQKMGWEKKILESSYVYGQWMFASSLLTADATVKNMAATLGVSSEDFLFKFFEQIDGVRKLWRREQAQSAYLLGAVASALSDRQSGQQITEWIGSYETNVKLMSEYAHMFYLAHLLSEKSFKKTIRGYFTSFDVDAKDMYAEIFRPKLLKMSWLDYTSSMAPLGFYNTLFALDFFIRSGAMEFFEIDKEKFFELMTSKVKNRFVFPVETKLASLESLMQNSSEYQRFLGQCEQLKLGLPISTRVPLSKIRSEIFMGDYAGSVFKSFNSVVNNKGEKEGINPLTEDLKEQAEAVRLDYKKVEQILNVSKQALSSVGLSSTTLQKAIDQQQESLKRARALFSTVSKTLSCYMRFLLKEKQVTQGALEKEAEYLGTVHDDLTKLRQLPKDQEETRKQITSKYARGGFRSDKLDQLNIPGWDRLLDDGYVYSYFDFIVRVSQYINQGQDTYEIVWPDNIKKSNEYNLDDSNSNQFLKLSWVPNKQEFIDSGLKKAYGQRKSYAVWWLIYNNMVYLKSLVEFQIQEAKVSGELNFDEVLSLYKGFPELLNVKPFERHLMEITGAIQKAPVISFTPLFVTQNLFEQTISSKRGIFDWYLYFFSADRYGTDYLLDSAEKEYGQFMSPEDSALWKSVAPMRNGPRAQAQSFHKEMTDLTFKNLFFTRSEEQKKYLYSDVLSQLKTDKKISDDFLNGITTKDLGDVHIEINLYEEIRSPLIRPQEQLNYNFLWSEFNRNTLGCFSNPEVSCY